MGMTVYKLYKESGLIEEMLLETKLECFIIYEENW